MPTLVPITQRYRFVIMSISFYPGILLPKGGKEQNKNYLNSSTIDELGSWCLERLVKPGSNQIWGRRYPWQPCERPPPTAPSH